jgi:hypothetical protein
MIHLSIHVPIKNAILLLASHNKHCTLIIHLQPGPNDHRRHPLPFPFAARHSRHCPCPFQPSVVHRHAQPLLSRCNLPLHRIFAARHSVTALLICSQALHIIMHNRYCPSCNLPLHCTLCSQTFRHCPCPFQPSVVHRHAQPLLPRCNLPLHRIFAARHSVTALEPDLLRCTIPTSPCAPLSPTYRDLPSLPRHLLPLAPPSPMTLPLSGQTFFNEASPHTSVPI